MNLRLNACVVRGLSQQSTLLIVAHVVLNGDQNKSLRGNRNGTLKGNQDWNQTGNLNEKLDRNSDEDLNWLNWNRNRNWNWQQDENLDGREPDRMVT